MTSYCAYHAQIRWLSFQPANGEKDDIVKSTSKDEQAWINKCQRPSKQRRQRSMCYNWEMRRHKWRSSQVSSTLIPPFLMHSGNHHGLGAPFIYHHVTLGCNNLKLPKLSSYSASPNRWMQPMGIIMSSSMPLMWHISLLKSKIPTPITFSYGGKKQHYN